MNPEQFPTYKNLFPVLRNRTTKRTEMVILVDERDQTIGEMEKIQAHQDGLLHRAFSIFIFNRKKQLLLQKRSLLKYHSGGLWSNTCCGHPLPSEDLEEALHRRLTQEMGFDSNLKKLFSFLYHARLRNNLIEYEIDHVFGGVVNDVHIQLNQDEVSEFKWCSIDYLENDMHRNPDNYTIWFLHAMRYLMKNGKNMIKHF